MANYKLGTELMLFNIRKVRKTDYKIATPEEIKADEAREERLKQLTDMYFPLACAKSCKFSIQVNTLDVSSKDSGYFVEKLAGKISWSCSSDNLFVMKDYESMTKLMRDRQPIYIQFSTSTKYVKNSNETQKNANTPMWEPDKDKETSKAEGYKGFALITSIEANAGDGEVATYSISMEGIGGLDDATFAEHKLA